MAALEEPQATAPSFTTAVTPSGIEIRYTWEPKRKYEVRSATATDSDDFWVEVPSVTTVLGCLDKPGLPWWGMKVGVQGVLDLNANGTLGELSVDAIVRQLTQQGLTVNHTLSNAGDRGSAVHDAFETWANTGQVPHPEIYPEEQAGYITGLVAFIRDFDAGGVAHAKTEIMVGSLAHGYAGRFDLRCYFNGGKMVTKSYPKRADKVELVPPGSYLLDLKTSKSVYATHAAQLIAYEVASIECGYSPTDGRAVVHVTEDGRYEFIRCNAQPEDFLSILATYLALDRGKKEWLS